MNKTQYYILKRSFQKVLNTGWQRVNKCIKRKVNCSWGQKSSTVKFLKGSLCREKSWDIKNSRVTLTQQRVNTSDHFKGEGKGGNRFHKHFFHPLSFSFTYKQLCFSGNSFIILGDTFVGNTLNNNHRVILTLAFLISLEHLYLHSYCWKCLLNFVDWLVGWLVLFWKWHKLGPIMALSCI